MGNSGGGVVFWLLLLVAMAGVATIIFKSIGDDDDFAD